jgi:hypothetical protein
MSKHTRLVVGSTLVGAAGSFCIFFGGCTSTSSNGGPEVDGSVAGFDAAGFDATGIDVTGIDVNTVLLDGGTPGTPDGGSPGDASSGADTGPLDAAPQLLVSVDAGAPQRLAVGGGTLYWTFAASPEWTSIGTYDTATGAVASVADPTNTPVQLFATDSTAVYWGDGPGDVVKLPFGSASPQVIGTGIGTASSAYEIASDGTDVYWAVPGYGVFEIPTTGSSVKATTLFAEISSTAATRGAVLVGGDLYVANARSGTNQGTIDFIPASELALDGGAPLDAATSIVTGRDTPSNITSDGTHLIWLDFTEPTTLYSADLDGGSVVQYAPADNGVTFATDGVSVYWPGYDGSTTTVEKAPIGNAAAAQALYTASYSIAAVALDDTWVYWIDGTNNRIYRAPK